MKLGWGNERRKKTLREVRNTGVTEYMSTERKLIDGRKRTN